MRKSALLKIAASPLVLGITMVGCTTGQMASRPAPASAKVATAADQAVKFNELAQEAAQKGDFGQALAYAEQAVELAPRDAGYRMTLGDLYMKNGRFLSAKTAFTDVLTLHPDNSRARFQLALAQIALGEQLSAMVQLDRLAETESAADLGLAYALAGYPDRAVQMLEPAAREMGANARVRQNLALAYALSGDWQRARTTAAQDLSPADVPSRMEQWASFVQPRASHDQVASLLGVTPVSDQGQPIRLALAPVTAQPVQMGVAEIPSMPAPIAEAPVEMAAVEAPKVLEQASVPAETYAEAAKVLVAPQPAVIQTASLPASKPVAAFVPAVKQSLEPRRTGRHVVQLGAYRSAGMAEAAWSQLSKRYKLADLSPVHATVQLPGKGTFHRLSVAGFSDQAEAARTCQSIKGKGGACFVRSNAGDAPIRFASRNNRKG